MTFRREWIDWRITEPTRLYSIHFFDRGSWKCERQTGKTRRGPQFFSPYEARCTCGPNPPKLHDGRRRLSTREDLYYYCNRHLFFLVLLHSPASDEGSKKINKCGQQKSVMWNLCHSTSQCSAVTRICCTHVCTHFFLFFQREKTGRFKNSPKDGACFGRPHSQTNAFWFFFTATWKHFFFFGSLCDFFPGIKSKEKCYYEWTRLGII